MRGLYKIICTAAGLSLMFGACTHEGRREARPDTAPQETAIPVYDETAQLAQRVMSLTKTVFPYGGVIDVGKNPRGDSRYIVINVLEENRVKLLEISLYMGSDSKLEADINEYLLNHDYKSIVEALNKGSLDVTRFHDYGGDGLRTNTDDFLTTRDKEGKLKTIKDNELSYLLETANETYKVVLRTTVAALEKELKSRG